MRKRWIDIARGDGPPDLVLRGGRVLSVFTGEVFRADVAIADGHVVGVGEYRGPNEVDVSERFLVPGFIDGHCHIESSKLNVDEFARAVLRAGTTTVVIDPHEMANVLGTAGVEYMLAASKNIPLGVYVMMPSCVPASQFESATQPLEGFDFTELLKRQRVLGVAEMMNYPAVIAGQTDALNKLAVANWEHIDGHAPGVSGRELNAYIVAGPSSDHECTTIAEALEKRRLGMWIMIREASMIRNLKDLLPMVQKYGTENTLFVTDDREAGTLLHEGHMNSMVRLAVRKGLSAGDAVKLASLNVARCHGLHRVGAIAPGYTADMLVLPDLESFEPEQVYKAGECVVNRSEVRAFARTSVPSYARDSVHVRPLSGSDFTVPLRGRSRATSNRAPTIRVIELVPNQVMTRAVEVEAVLADNQIVASPAGDLAKVAVVERHHATGRVGVGFVRGFGLRNGAFASTVAHDAHNIVVVGMNDTDMCHACRRLSELGGGLVVIDNGRVSAELPLPIAGLMSEEPAEVVAAGLERLEGALRSLGVSIPTPFMYISFLALSVIPELRVTDRGIVDVRRFELVPLVIEG